MCWNGEQSVCKEYCSISKLCRPCTNDSRNPSTSFFTCTDIWGATRTNASSSRVLSLFRFSTNDLDLESNAPWDEENIKVDSDEESIGSTKRDAVLNAACSKAEDEIIQEHNSRNSPSQIKKRCGRRYSQVIKCYIKEFESSLHPKSLPNSLRCTTSFRSGDNIANITSSTNDAHSIVNESNTTTLIAAQGKREQSIVQSFNVNDSMTDDIQTEVNTCVKDIGVPHDGPSGCGLETRFNGTIARCLPNDDFLLRSVNDTSTQSQQRRVDSTEHKFDISVSEFSSIKPDVQAREVDECVICLKVVRTTDDTVKFVCSCKQVQLHRKCVVSTLAMAKKFECVKCRDKMSIPKIIRES